MRRVISAILLVAAVVGFVTLSTGAGDTKKGYEVRAIFDNAFSVIPGEDVKIAGVKVGKITGLDVTDDQKAAVTLSIQKPGFEDFRKDASCTIRPQSLIGEKFVECTPTQPRPTGAQPSPPLRKITDGPGKGQYLLPASQNGRAVDIDLVNNILRLPYRQRLSILINEFGTALAGRGKDVSDIIRNADPGLKALDRVLAILSSQDDVIAKLAQDSDTSLAPLARERNHVADFVDKAANVASATAERRADLEKNIQRLPKLFAQLRPTMVRLGALSDQASPVLDDLHAVAPSVNRFIQQLGPFSTSATASLVSLGDASVPGRQALVKSLPIVNDLRTFASTSRPLSTNLREILTSFRDTGGIERLMDYIFYQVAAINGFDANGHYLRAQLLVNTCSIFATTNDVGCTANFGPGASTRSVSTASDKGRSPALLREEAVLKGKTADSGQTTDADGGASTPKATALKLPTSVLPGGKTDPGSPVPAPSTPAPSATDTHVAAPDGDQAASSSLLDYLLGGQ